MFNKKEKGSDPFSSYINKIQDRKKLNLYRDLVNSDCLAPNIVKRNRKKLVSFACNDYFGLSQNKKVKKAAIKAIKKYGLGARASRFVTGNNSLYEKLEKKIAKMKNADAAIVFASGYQSAIGVIPALVGKGDLILVDKLMHSCCLDGSQLSGAKLMRFLHNNISHIEKILQENRHNYDKCLIISETVFSMDGDKGKIKELLKLAKKYDCLLISDAAHDLFLSKPINDDYHIRMGTLSKGVGSLGGYVAGNKKIIDYLKNFSKSLIYSTALPPAVLAGSLKSLEIIEKKNPGWQALQNAKYFCQKMQLSEPESAIVPIIIGDDKKSLEIAQKIEKFGLLISAIRFPTVPKGEARLRIVFSSDHRQKDIDSLVEALNS